MLKFSEQPKETNSLESIFGSKKESKLDVLHGSGFTSRKAKQADADLNQREAAAQHIIADSEAIRETQSSDPIVLSAPVPSDITWDESQLAAIEGLQYEQFGCLIGAAGTGKTTVTKELVARLQGTISLMRTVDALPPHLRDKDAHTSSGSNSQSVAIAFCAFTGRATEQLKKALPPEYHGLCSTIHSLLGYMPEMEPWFNEDDKMWQERKVFRPSFTAANKLPHKIILIDETGMLPILLWNELVAAMTPDCRVIMIGDINQLPPVQGRSVLGFAMLKWPTFTLETIHRQAADNPIIANAHRILQGLSPKQYPGQFEIKAISDGSQKAFGQVTMFMKQLYGNGEFDPVTDAFIVPQNKGQLGQVSFNESFVQAFNPSREDGTNRREIIRAGRTNPMLAVNDKVMLLQNDRERNLTNGMTGMITAINMNGKYRGDHHSQMDDFDFESTDASFDLNDIEAELKSDVVISVAPEEEEDENKRQASHVVTVEFQAGATTKSVQFSTSGQFAKLTHAYAFTCHKSQGGEYPTVVIVCHSANGIMLNREWLYTAITRAQGRIILLCNDRGISKAIRVQTIKGTTVAEKAQSFLDLQDRSDTKMPELAEPYNLLEAA